MNFLSYVEITAEDNIDGFRVIFPNATSNVLLSLNDKVSLNQDLTDSSIYASCASTVTFKPYVGMKFMAIQFSSFGLYYLKAIPANELHDTLFDLDLLFLRSDIDRIICQLNELETIEEKFMELEFFIRKHIAPNSVDPRLPYSIHSLKTDLTMTIDSLSDSLGITSRRVQKIFKQYIGIGPAYYRKITRFNRAANFLLMDSDRSLTNIAYECGYYDQAHFIKDFRKFGGISPSEFLTLKADSSDFYNYNLKDVDRLAPEHVV